MLDRLYNQLLDETVYKTKLENNLTVYLIEKEGFKKNYALLATDYGSNDIDFTDRISGEDVTVPAGIAHFLEHKLFEGKKESIFDKFASLGASTNAYTNFTSTSYLFSTTANFYASLTNLLDFVQEPYFTEENVEKEKGIIIQEIKMYEDDPHWQSYFSMLTAMYQKHPVRNDIAGTVESVMEITPEDLYLCYNNFYQPDNMVLILIGDFDKEETIEEIKNNQAKKEFKMPNKINKIFPQEPTTVVKQEVRRQMNVSRPLINLGYKDPETNLGTRELVKKDFAVNMLLDCILGKGSNLFQDLYAKGYIDNSFSTGYNCTDHYGYLQITGETDQPNILLDILKKELLHIKADDINDSFDRIRRKYIGNYIKLFNNFSALASESVNYHFRNLDIFSVIDILTEVKKVDLLAYKDTLLDSEQHVGVIIEN